MFEALCKVVNSLAFLCPSDSVWDPRTMGTKAVQVWRRKILQCEATWGTSLGSRPLPVKVFLQWNRDHRWCPGLGSTHSVTPDALGQSTHPVKGSGSLRTQSPLTSNVSGAGKGRNVSSFMWASRKDRISKWGVRGQGIIHCTKTNIWN